MNKKIMAMSPKKTITVPERQRVFFYDVGIQHDPAILDKMKLGGKGYGLFTMAADGLPVPPGFTIDTVTNEEYYSAFDNTLPPELLAEVKANVKKLEASMGRELGNPDKPLLVAVRSGAARSMPGMMDTVLNLGINDKVAAALAKQVDERFAYDTYRRFIQIFGNVVLEIELHEFEGLILAMKAAKGYTDDRQMTAEDYKQLVEQYKAVIKKHTGADLEQDPMRQLEAAIKAVFGSWNNDRAVLYREKNKIHDLKGTAVNVVAMVFGNLNDRSGSGVGFTRNPSTGEHEEYGEFLVNAQGEEVVAGIRTPLHISEMKDRLPEVAEQLQQVARALEKRYKWVQDFEFTVMDGKLYMLQTRDGKSSMQAVMKFAVDLVNDGTATIEEVIAKIEAGRMNELLLPQIDPVAAKQAIALTKGISGAPGGAVGQIIFDPKKAAELKAADSKAQLILVRHMTTPEDLGGMYASEGILTTTGGATSHAAVVARGAGKATVVGAGEIVIDYKAGTMRVGDTVLKEGDWISLNGTTGEVIVGQLPTVAGLTDENYEQVMKWVDERRTLGIRMNAETLDRFDAEGKLSKPGEVGLGLKFGATGIGLARTEHMFFDHVVEFRRALLAKSGVERKAAFDELLKIQEADFLQIFRLMQGKPTTIRLLDPPLHEFMPHTTDQQDAVASQLGIPIGEIAERVKRLHEENPMLGTRGSRLALAFPGIYEMQARAIIRAAMKANAEGIKTVPEIMLPLIMDANEFVAIKKLVVDEINKQFSEAGMSIPYLIGTMIELPSAALLAGDIAPHVDFLSFGTNDMTQTTLGLSRDDTAAYIEQLVKQGVWKVSPFETLHPAVMKIIQIAVEAARAANPKIKIGICGEHGGDPQSIEFLANVGVNYVSASPFRLPGARVAAAQEALKAK